WQPSNYLISSVIRAASWFAVAQELHELLARLGVGAERAKHRRRRDVGILLLDDAHPHAQMLGLEHHGDAERIDLRHQGLRDLRRQALLHLEPSRVDFDQPRQLRDSDYF